MKCTNFVEKCLDKLCSQLVCSVYLQHKVPVWGQLKVQVLVVQMFSEGQQEFVLPADVCSQDQRAQLLLHVLPAE